MNVGLHVYVLASCHTEGGNTTVANESFVQNFHILTHTHSANFLVDLLGGKYNTCYENATSLSSCNRLRPFDNLIELIFKKDKHAGI